MQKLFVIGIAYFMITQSALSGSLTREVWDATKGNFLTGELDYGDIHWSTGPGGEYEAMHCSWELLKDSGCDYRDMVLKAPETVKNIYDLGIVQSYLNYESMVGDNWRFAKLSRNDFNAACQSYIEEGNWGLLQSSYYCLKGCSRTLWALGILNSAEGLYSIGRVGVLTTYYVVKYPVGGTLKMVLSPVVFVGGTVWSFTTSLFTTGWALPIAPIIDAGKLVTGKL